MEKHAQKTVLVAGVGLSPAVLTNTVWALAHEKKPVVPDEVVAVTTLTGRRCIEEQLIASKGWNRRNYKVEPCLRPVSLPEKQEKYYAPRRP